MNEERLRGYLKRDRKGIRRRFLEIMLSGRELSTDEIYEYLKGFDKDLTQKSVMAMLGAAGSKLGIVRRVGNKRYVLKQEYIEKIRRLLDEFYKKGDL